MDEVNTPQDSSAALVVRDSYEGIVVCSTHWDREWYSLFQHFRRRLVKLLDGLLQLLETKPAFSSFTLDGQTVLLEDYLELRPEGRVRLEKQIRQGRLFVGPWYVLPDEFLVSGESLLRNLGLGYRIAQELGRRLNVGYIPDPFGHIAQLPQILRGFGLGSAIFSRGLDDRGEELANEFWWEGLDGTRIFGVYQRNSYGNLKNWGMQEEKLDLELALNQVKLQIQQLGPKGATEWVLLENGGDHCSPQPEVPEIIESLNELLDKVHLRQGTFEEYVEAVLSAKPKLGLLQGELHGARYWPILPGVYSARLYLKQANERTQTLLEKWAEPLSVAAWLEGKEYETSLLRHSWKLCLQNHPHDSSCGCSIDHVHQEMLPRFAQSQQISEMLVQESLEHIASKIDTRFPGPKKPEHVAVVWNPHGREFTGRVRERMERALTKKAQITHYRVLDADGNPVPVQLRRREKKQYLPEGGSWNMHVDSVELCWLAEKVPALGYSVYQIFSGKPEPVPTDLHVGANWAENSLIRVSFNPNGSFDLLDKKTGHVFSGLHIFEDTEDIGDEYNYCPAKKGATFTTAESACQIKMVEAGPIAATFRLEWDLRLPEALKKDRQSRSFRKVICPITSEITVWASSPRVEIRTTVENRASDHRLRVLFGTDLKTDKCQVDTAFGVVERSLQLPSGENWVEKPMGTKAQQRFVAVEDGKAGLCLMNVGLPEYEVRPETAGAAFCLTLLRCVGWLGRDDLETRPSVAGPMLPTPEAQCIGTYHYHYALLPYGGVWQEARVWRSAQGYAAQPRISVTKVHPGKLPKRFSYISLSPENLILSAVKKAEFGTAIIVRAYNTTSTPVEGEITFGKTPTSVRLVDLKEEPLENETVSWEGQKARIHFGPYQIRTLEVAFPELEEEFEF